MKRLVLLLALFACGHSKPAPLIFGNIEIRTPMGELSGTLDKNGLSAEVNTNDKFKSDVNKFFEPLEAVAEKIDGAVSKVTSGIAKHIGNVLNKHVNKKSDVNQEVAANDVQDAAGIDNGVQVVDTPVEPSFDAPQEVDEVVDVENPAGLN